MKIHGPAILMPAFMAVLLIAGVLNGCAPPELPYLMPVSEFSFTGFWDEILNTTGASGNRTHLQSFDLRAREDKIVYSSAMFSSYDNEGNLFSFAIVTDSQGQLEWLGGDLQEEIPERPMYDPAETFAELDSIGIESIIDGAKSTDFRIDYIYDERHCNYADMYRLDNGELLPLREVSFRKDACAATIQVLRSCSRDADTPFALGMFRSMGEWWFTGNDLKKAESVVLAKNQQRPEFVSFLKGIYNTIPEGWEMRLSTHEGYMDSPQGLEEPLFRLDFEDTENSFSIVQDPTNTTISPNLVLLFYDIKEKEAIMKIIEEQEKYSWDIPLYYDESPLYIAVTSPVYINCGRYEDEAMMYYEPLEEALKS